MTFNYKWTNRENASYAIQKRNTAGRDAGKEIEYIERQTSKTHFFLKIGLRDWESDKNIPRINDILKTITYEYFYKGTNTKSIRQYLTKADIDKVLHNIENLRNKTIRIEITPPTKKESDLEIRHWAKDEKQNLINKYGEEKTENVLNLILKRSNKENEFEKRKKEVRAKIRKLNDDLAILETQINTDIAEIEKIMFVILYNYEKEDKIKIDFLMQNPVVKEGFKGIMKTVYRIAKTNKQIDVGKKRQQEYRERKAAESGKPKRKVGRPRKSEI